MAAKRKPKSTTPKEINMTDLPAGDPDRRREAEHREDVFAAGTPGGGAAAGGLAGTNLDDGDPDNADLDNAMGDGALDTNGNDERRDAFGMP